MRIAWTGQAAAAQSNMPNNPLVIPQLYRALKVTADSIRDANRVPRDSALLTPLAVQGDSAMRYNLMARVIQTARVAGFRNLSLQVTRTATAQPAAAQTTAGR